MLRTGGRWAPPTGATRPPTVLDVIASPRLAWTPTTMAQGTDALELFHPLIRQWFADRVGEPTEVQRLAWPRIAAGEHVLVTAPTGSGKTLAAFLWAINRLIAGALPGGNVRVLYVSPLRALNNDIRRNLLAPLEELRAAFAAARRCDARGQGPHPLGDTPAEERRAHGAPPARDPDHHPREPEHPAHLPPRAGDALAGSPP